MVANLDRTLNLFAGLELRDKGMAKAAASRNALLNLVRSHVELVARGRKNRIATANDIAAYLKTIGKDSTALGNAAGSVFRNNPSFEPTQSFVQSERPQSRARMIRVWRLK